ncbi:MAG: hypothetical protein HOO86_08675 [Bacteroidales bacterium]|nr:hypothetical protein [Bacteroidales bacterium]
MKKIKVALLFGTKPNFEHDAFKYFILYVNRIQNIYEFCFPDIVEDYPFDKGDVDFKSSHDKVNAFVINRNLNADHFIAIITNSFSNNYFFNAEKRTSIITTDIWDKQFSPPSLFEYLLHCIFTCLIYSQNVAEDTELSDDQMLINIGSHRDARGCIADFTRQKYEDRISIALGYICEEHSKEIEDFYGTDYLKQIQYVIDRKWIGDISEKGSVAYNLKHIFKFNINKDSGFNKNWWDKIKDKFYEIPGTLTGEILKIIITVILTYLLIKWGLIDK